MDDSCQIRDSEMADLPDLLRLYSQLGQDDGHVLSLEAAAAIWGRIRSYPDYRVRIALREGLVVGTYAILVMDNLGHCGAKSAVVEDVVVDSEFRGHGIGKAMMQDAAAIARTRRCYKIVLNSNRHRLDAHRFYENIGYERHGHSFFLPLETP